MLSRMETERFKAGRLRCGHGGLWRSSGIILYCHRSQAPVSPSHRRKKNKAGNKAGQNLTPKKNKAGFNAGQNPTKKNKAGNNAGLVLSTMSGRL
jgi:hypothetical protein